MRILSLLLVAARPRLRHPEVAAVTETLLRQLETRREFFPCCRPQPAFEAAVREVADVTERLLRQLEAR